MNACCASSATADVRTLTPAADTYVSAGKNTRRNHGRASQLRVDGSRRVAYVEFDLSGLPAPIAQATLALSPTRSSRNGGTVYGVDGRLDAADASRLVPGPENAIGPLGPVRRRTAIRLDVTAALAGAPVAYTFAVAGAATAAYASREYHLAARRPTLEVVLQGDGGSGADPGPAAVLRIANSSMQRFTDRPAPDAQTWMRGHYWRMLTYTPYFDSRLAWYPSAWVYKDLYAIYPGSAQATLHPEWILRDASGGLLFIPWGCGGGTCPQYAADPGNAAFRAQWIADAREVLARGYQGLFVDDVNLLMSRVSDGAGDAVVPLDPRTGRPMREADWRRYVAEFVEAIRDAFPTIEIVHNAIWYVGDDDPSVARQIAAADYQFLERGVNDSGIVRGAGPYGYDTFLAHTDRVHAAGHSILLAGQGTDVAGLEYSLATYFLARATRDGITHNHGTTPDDWWTGWDAALGAPRGARYAWSGLWRRDFSGGFVLVNPPGASTQDVPLGGTFRDLAGDVVTSVVLGSAEGAVLRAP